MRVMIDTNVLISAVYNPNSKPAHAVRNVCENHELLLCDQIVAECYDVVERKFLQHIPVLDKLLTSLGYSFVVAPRGGNAPISDPKDAPILYSAVCVIDNFRLAFRESRQYVHVERYPYLVVGYLEKIGGAVSVIQHFLYGEVASLEQQRLYGDSIDVVSIQRKFPDFNTRERLAPLSFHMIILPRTAQRVNRHRFLTFLPLYCRLSAFGVCGYSSAHVPNPPSLRDANRHRGNPGACVLCGVSPAATVFIVWIAASLRSSQ